MRRRLKAGSSPDKRHRRKSITLKGRNGPKAERGRSAAIEARHLERSLRESEERYDCSSLRWVNSIRSF